MEIQVGELIKKAKVSRCGEGDYPVLSMTMHDGLMFQNDRFKKQIASVDQSNYQVVKRHQLVESFPIDEGVLAVQELTKEGIVSPAYKIWDVNMDKVLPVYLELALRSPRSIEYYKSKLRGTTARRRSITDAEFCAMQINLPDLKEQERIIELISRTKAIAAKRQQELDTLDNLIKARFVELFGDYYKNHVNEKRLDEICDFIDYRGKTPEKSEEGIPLITAKNVKDNRFTIEPQEFIPEENYDEVMTRGFPRVNDVLFTTEAPLGNVCRIPNVYDKFCVGQRLITMQPHEDVLNSEYLEHALASSEFQDKMWQKSSGSTVKGIRSKLLVLLTIPVPPIGLQNQFKDFLKQVDKSKVAVQKSLDETQRLFDSLMQEYFG
ncbi:MAG: restriction endonuclease subunit S [Butyrivibrio sp.]|nr:restriction endonuclease subunit S [Butyrivibrio sp.]